MKLNTRPKCVRVCLPFVVLAICGFGDEVVAASVGCASAQIISISVQRSETQSERGCRVKTADESRMSCSDFQSAINWIADTSVLLVKKCVKIQLPNGKHLITQQSDIHNVSMYLVGLGEHVMVQCNYFADPNRKDSRKIHTWYFERSDSVTFQNIHFRHCGFPFRFDTTKNIFISNCTFRYFTEAVLDMYNCENVNITDTVVQDNSGTGRLVESFRGNTGGIAIGYNSLPDDYFNPMISISNTVFQNNRAWGFRTPNRAVTASVYLGRGGGLGLFLNESVHNLTFTISGCVFENNTARLFGGGLFIVTLSHLSNQLNIVVERSTFKQNHASYGGGGVQLSYLRSGSNSRPHTVAFTDCEFVDNRSPSGSGIYIFVGDDGNLAKFKCCNFTGNTGLGSQLDFGAAIALSFLSVFRQRVISPRHEITECFFSGNRGPNGVVSIGYAPAVFGGNTIFLNNHGASLRIIGSVVDFEGETTFTNNSVVDFGALQLLSFAQVRLKSGSSMKFSGNIGKLGASIVVNSPASILAFRDILFNPKCFILYEDKTAPPSEWDNVNVTFTGNQAIVASSVYISRAASTCSWFDDIPPYFNNTHIPDWPLWKYKDNLNVGYNNALDQQFSFGTAAEKLSADADVFQAWPGQRVSVPLKGLDHFNHSTSVNARLFFESQNHSLLSTVKFDPEIIAIAGRAKEPKGQEILQENFSLQYIIGNITILQSDSESLGQINIEELFHSQTVEPDSFSFSPLPCPPGYSLNPVSPNNPYSMHHCTCLDSLEIITCEEDQHSVIIKDGLWAGYVPSRTPNLWFYPCPSGYCRCFQNTSLGSNLCASVYSHSAPDLQCKCRRKGILCGSCKYNYGVSVLLNECTSCSDVFGTLVGVLVILDVIVIVVVSLIDKPLPVWSYPFLFYIQMTPYAAESFAPGFEIAGKYLYFISSAMSFYFIYDFCIHSNLSPQLSYFLRYLPLFTAFIAFPVIWLIRKCARKKWKALRKHGYWWVILLLYSHIVHTSMSILNCPRIPDSSGNEAPRWYISGDIQCFKGGHVPLALLAVLILALCILIIPTLMVVALKTPERIQTWVDPLKIGFRDEVKWWSGIELGRRLLFLLFIVLFPNNIVHGMLVLVLSIVTYSYVLPYKSRVANAIEVIVQLNFLTLLVLEATPLFQETLYVFSAPELERSRVECVNSPAGTSSKTWLLLPFYYLPVLGLILSVVGVCTVSCIIKRVKKHKSTSEAEEDTYTIHKTNVTTQVVEIDFTKQEGEVELRDDHPDNG